MVRGNTKAIGRRGRPPKNAESAQKLAESRKPKYLYSGSLTKQDQSSNQITSVSSTPQNKSVSETKNNKFNSSNNGRSLRTRSKRKSNNKWDDDTDEEDYPQTKRRGVYLDTYNNSSYDFDDDEDQSDREEELEEPDEFAGEDEEDSLTSFSTNTSKNYPWERAQRPKSPPVFNEDNLPHLTLPKSSKDLLLSDNDVDNYLLQICSVYEILKHFKFQLRLSSFRLEEFIAALQLDEINSLCSEIHITLLKVLVKEDENNGTVIGASDVKDSVNIHLYCCDVITWPPILKLYLSARARGQTNKSNVAGDIEAKRVIQVIKNSNYPIGVSLKTKLLVLQFLCDSFLETNIAREEILNIESMTIKHDDHCRKCHKLGDLLCCDNCPSVWHLQCLDPPMNNVPTNEWICHICKSMNIEELEATSVRKEILGWDRHGRKYWWLCQRIIIEKSNDDDENEIVHYYSTRQQFNELINVLDKNKYEKELVEVLLEMNNEIFKGFDNIAQLTQNALVLKCLMFQNIKSWIELNNEEVKVNDEHDNSVNETNPTSGIVTRLKTGALQPKSVNAESKIVNGDIYSEDRDILYVWNSDKDNKVLKRINKKLLSTISNFVFKLGMEAKTFVNYFNVNILALNKYQLQEERDKKRQLSYKFSLTPMSEFKWLGSTYGSQSTLIQTFKKTLIHFENSLNAPFLHPNWSLHRQNWLTAVQMCNNAKDFALALSILESSIKPVLFNPVWNDALGHNILERTTVLDREDRKKVEKRERREQSEELDMLIRLGGVKYTLMPNRLKDGVWCGQGVGRGVHQLWKQRGEEYRVTGKGGWTWLSSTRIQYKDWEKIQIEKTEELTEEEKVKVKSVETINVMRELNDKFERKRIFYPKIFKKKSRPKLLLLENLLEKRIALKKALELEKKKLDEQSNKSKLDEKFYIKCYSFDCRNKLKEDNLYKCFSHDCNNISKENISFCNDDEEEFLKEISQVFYCVKPVYLYNVNDKNEILRKLNCKRLLGKGQLPPCSRFVTKGGKKSIFVLPNYELRKLSRSAALREVRGFSYSAKLNPYIWPFGTTPRPLFRTCWLYRNSIIEKDHGVESVSLFLRIIWSCIRWDDMANRPPSGSTITTETEVITTELLKRRDLAPFGIRSEYLVRKIVVPIEFENEKDDNDWKDSNVRISDVSSGSKREGLRERKKKVYVESEIRKQGPSVTETWIPEEELHLWEIKGFGEKLEKQQQLIKEREKERIQKENARKLMEENLRKQQERKKALSENNRFTPLIQTKNGAQIKRIFASPASNSLISNADTQQQKTQISQINQNNFAMIRTVGGQTYRIPVSALQGKLPGQQIIIKTGNNTGQITNTTTATIISTNTQTVSTPVTIQNQYSSSTSSTTPTSNTVRPLILSNSSNNTTTSNLATGISSSSLSLQQGSQATPQKIQIIKQVPVSTSSNQTTKIKITANTMINNQNQTPIQIPIKLPDGRVQIIQLPACMLNSSTPIQIAIPQSSQATNSATSTTTPVIRTITQNSQGGQSVQIVTQIPQQQVIQQIGTNQQIKLISNSVSQTTTPRIIQIRQNSSAANVQPNTSNSTNNSNNQVTLKPNVPLTVSQTLSKQISTPVKTGTIHLKINYPNVTSPSNVVNTPEQKPKVIPSSSTPNESVKLPQVTDAQSKTLSNQQLLQHQQLDENPCETDESSFKITPQITNEIVKAALSSKTNTPEIHQKLLALQKHTQQQQIQASVTEENSSLIQNSKFNSFSQSKRSTAGGLIRAINRTNVNKTIHLQPTTYNQIRNTPATSRLLEDERDDLVIKTIIKAMIEKIEKDEKQEIKRKKTRENQLQAKWRQTVTKYNAKLNNNVDLLRKDIQRRRAHLQSDLKKMINEEIKLILNQQKNVDKPDEKSESENNVEILRENSTDQSSKLIEQPVTTGKIKEMAIQFEPTSISSVNSVTSLCTSNKRKSNNNNNNSFSFNNDNTNSSNNTISNNRILHKRVNSQSSILKRRKITPISPFDSEIMDNVNSDSNSTINNNSANSSSNKIQKRLYCICRQPYDSKRFMVGCDYCHNWFHCDCLGIEENEVKKMASFVCQNCRETNGSDLDEDEYLNELSDDSKDLNIDDEENKLDVKTNIDLNSIKKEMARKQSSPVKRKILDSPNKPVVQKTIVKSTPNGIKGIRKQLIGQKACSSESNASESEQENDVKEGKKKKEDKQLYCICRTPYIESQFYVQCEKCSEWLHGRCVGVLCKEAEKIDVYLCPQCDPKSTINYANQKKLDITDYDQLQKLLKSIQQHKNAWPFLKPVDERQVPDYYSIIKEPMDLATVENKLNKQAYPTLTKFIGDITKIFDNCRYFNDSKSSITHCANILESFFVQKIKFFRQQMIRN